MANFNLTASQQFPEATTVGVFPKAAKNPGGAPVGNQITSAAVTNGVAAFTGLVLNTPYTAYALVSGQHRYVDFVVRESDKATRRAQLMDIVLVEVTIDLPSIAANAVADVNVALPAGTAKVGDIVVPPLLPALNAGLHIQGVGVVATDSLRVRAQNTTAGALDAAAVTTTIAIIRVS